MINTPVMNFQNIPPLGNPLARQMHPIQSFQQGSAFAHSLKKNKQDLERAHLENALRQFNLGQAPQIREEDRETHEATMKQLGAQISESQMRTKMMPEKYDYLRENLAFRKKAAEELNNRSLVNTFYRSISVLSKELQAAVLADPDILLAISEMRGSSGTILLNKLREMGIQVAPPVFMSPQMGGGGAPQMLPQQGGMPPQPSAGMPSAPGIPGQQPQGIPPQQPQIGMPQSGVPPQQPQIGAPQNRELAQNLAQLQQPPIPREGQPVTGPPSLPPSGGPRRVF